MPRPKDSPRILITVPHACNERLEFKWFCDDSAKEIGEEIAHGLEGLGYEVDFIYTDSFRGFIDANQSEATMKKLPNGNELEKRLKKFNTEIQELKNKKFLPVETTDLSQKDVIQEIAKATDFREKVKESAKNSHVHIDVHSFGGCKSGIKNFECRDVAVLDIVFYGKDNKMSKGIVKRLREQGKYNAEKFKGSRANDTIRSNKVANSLLIEFNRDMIDDKTQRRVRKIKREIKKEREVRNKNTPNDGEKKRLKFTEDEVNDMETKAFKETMLEITTDFVPILDETIRSVTKRTPGNSI